MGTDLQIDVVPGENISADQRSRIIDLCNRAFNEDMEGEFASFPDPTHILGFVGSKLISHALWVTRWLQVGTGPILRTAYVEAVATEREFRGRGYASALMKRLLEEIQSYELGALSPFSVAFYERFGWELWRGPLYVRTERGVVRSFRDGDVLILRLKNTPSLDLYTSLSVEWREGEIW
jgi:aminoglycoside 2'-N-acetyltransferase I